MEQAETSSKTCFAIGLKERVGGEYVPSFDSYHTPQSLRDSSSILEEQPDIQLFIFIELTLN